MHSEYRLLIFSDLSDFQINIFPLIQAKIENIKIWQYKIQDETLQLIQLFSPSLILVDYSNHDQIIFNKISDISFHSPQIPILVYGKTFTEEEITKLLSVGALECVSLDDVNALADTVKRCITKKFIKKHEYSLKQKNLFNYQTDYQSLFNFSPAGISIHDSNGMIWDVNDTLCKSLGYERNELIGQYINIFIPSEFHEQLSDIIQQILEGDTLHRDVTCIKKDGSIIYLELKETAILLPDGSMGVLTVSVDITARKIAEFKMRQKALTDEAIAQLTHLILNPSSSISLVAEKVLSYLIDFTESEIGCISWFNQQKNIYEYISLKKVNDNSSKKFIALDSSKICELVNKNKKKKQKTLVPGFINEFSQPKASEDNLTQSQIIFRRVLEYPVLLNQRLIGNIYLVNKEQPYVQSDIDTVSHFANLFGLTYNQQITREQLEISENRYRSFMNSSSDLICLKDNEFKYRFCNKVYADFFNLPIDELIGKTDFDFMPVEMAETCHISDKSAIDTNQVIISKEFIGNQVFETTKFPVLLEGNKTGVGCIIRDITEKQKQEILRLVLFNIANAVTKTTDMVEMMTHIRKFLSKIIDTTNFYIALLNADKETLSTTFFYKDERDDISSWPLHASLTGKVILSGLPKIYKRDEIEKMIERGEIQKIGTVAACWLGVPLRSANDTFGAIVVQSYDNTEAFSEKDVDLLSFVSNQISLSIQRKIFESDLKSALIKAKESDELKTVFLNNISHEIRTPMNGIVGFTELFLDEANTEEQRKLYGTIIQNNSYQLLSIIDSIIQISTLEAGQEKLRRVKTDIVEIFKNLEIQFKRQILTNDISLKFQIVPECKSLIILEDETKLIQILSNLISNALKFTHQGYIQVSCKAEEEYLLFTVQDTGIGIPDEYQEKIFERFVQAPGVIEKGLGGNGLGLAICKAYVDLMKGKIWVKSKLNFGSTFYFSIPRQSFDVHETNQKKMPSNTKNHISMKGKTVLIAEDEPVNFALANAILSPVGLNVIHVRNGREAVEICRQNTDIQLIIMDLKMPEMDGFEATQLIKQFNPNVPIIAVTAYAGDQEKLQAISCGCVDYLSKPYKKAELIQIVEQYINQ